MLVYILCVFGVSVLLASKSLSPGHATTPAFDAAAAAARAPAEASWEGGEEEEDDEPLDETDPLFVATLRIAGGDREAALRMLEESE